MFPMLGILYVGAACRQAGAEVLLWDMNYSADPPVEECDILMVTANTPTWPTACEVATRIRAGLKVVGGPHPTATGERGPFDLGCKGPGERAAMWAVSYMLGNPMSPTAPAPEVWPAYDLWPELGQVSACAVEGEEPEPGCSIITSRGCPYACNFCASEVMWHRRVRFREVEDVLAEAKYLHGSFGIRQLSIKDDVANLKKPRFAELCRGFSDLGMKWRMHTRTDHVSLDEFRMMKDCGCVEVGFGVESGSQRMLNLMGKANTVENNERAIVWANEVGLRPRIYLIVGFPGETWESVHQTLDFVRRTRPHRALVNNFVPYPGCPVWNNPAAFGCTIDKSNLETYWQVGLEEDEGFQAAFDSMTREELREARRVLQEACEQLTGSPDRRKEAALV
jgi:radical SAM superfamily enzyme YgiQ (UPF0313 family)